MPNITKPAPIDESSDVVHDDTTGGTDGNPHSLSAELDDTGVLRAGQVPNLAITNTSTVTTESDLTTLDAEEGDVGIVTDQSQAYILTTSDPTTLANWSVIQTPPAPVDDVFGRTGSIDPQSGDYSASEIANFASTALSAINAEINATATSVAGLDDATNSHIGASNPHAGSADTNHGNEAHSSTFAVDGATQPPENHGNGAHIESYITSAEAPVQTVNGETGDVSVPTSGWEVLLDQTFARNETMEFDIDTNTYNNIRIYATNAADLGLEPNAPMFGTEVVYFDLTTTGDLIQNVDEGTPIPFTFDEGGLVAELYFGESRRIELVGGGKSGDVISWDARAEDPLGTITLVDIHEFEGARKFIEGRFV